jgi:hypothetical protein
MNIVTSTVLLGLGATAMMDIWGLLRRPLLGMAAPDYRLVGRWIGHMVHGRFRHESIASAAPLPRERLIGWTAHYLTGMVFATALVAIAGREWMLQPSIAPALIVGVGSLIAPFLLMQPAMGAGVAARRTPRPGQARLQSLLTHTAFGFGLYFSGWTLRMLQAA